jgi:hypothetical protein
MHGNDPLLGCYRTCKALQGPEDAFLQFKGASSIHMQTFHSSNKKTFWGGGRDYDPQIPEVPWEQEVPLH